jgi:hypothetical protein
MTFTITKKFMVRLENIEGFPNLDIIYESTEVDYLTVAGKIKKNFVGETKISGIYKGILDSVDSNYHWEFILGTSNL